MNSTEKTPEIGLIGISHKTASVEIRENFSLDDSSIDKISELAGQAEINEIVCISTCNRTELYYTSNNIQKSIEALTVILTDISSFSGTELEKVIYKKFNKDAILHLLTVTSSLDSMVVGENEILGQVKEAYRKATALKKTGPVLNKLFHQAFNTAKKVKTETEIARSPLSVAFIATELAKSIFEDLSRHKALMVGAGEMAELILKYLTKFNIKKITIANRSFHNAQRIMDQLGSDAEIITLDDLKDAAGKVDIIISSVSSSEYIFTKELAKKALKAKSSSPLFIIDIAVPRNIDPAIGELDGIFLYNIDDLQQIANENLKSRLKEVELAKTLIESDADDFHKWYEGLSIVPAIRYVKDKYNNIRKNEIERYRKSRLKHLSDRDFEIIEQLTKQIMKKTLHDPIMYFKKFQSGSGQKEALKKSIKVVLELFGK
ncbi:MAG: glutamyl-tRNA reductase [Spirochaetes bacterium]|nr:glutamyl-tRNA reductase [Spirochaetota bacterium]